MQDIGDHNMVCKLLADYKARNVPPDRAIDLFDGCLMLLATVHFHCVRLVVLRVLLFMRFMLGLVTYVVIVGIPKENALDPIADVSHSSSLRRRRFCLCVVQYNCFIL